MHYKTWFLVLALFVMPLQFAYGESYEVEEDMVPGIEAANPVEADGCCPELQEKITLTKDSTRGYSEELFEYQKGLHILGIYHGRANGRFDDVTKQAVKDFQLRYHLGVDGVIGPQTKWMLTRVFDTMAAHSTEKKAPKGKVHLVIDVDKKTLSVYDDKKLFKKFYVAVGKEETPTPIGEWKIKRKALNWGTGFGTRWLGLNVPWGIFGIHGTNKPWSIGTEASHGCIRMFNRDVEQLYPWVKVGTPVTITGEIYPPLYEERPNVHKGHKGSAVVLVQQGLAREGYLSAEADGNFGPQTEEALKKLQKDRGLEVTGQVDTDTWPVLGL